MSFNSNNSVERDYWPDFYHKFDHDFGQPDADVAPRGYAFIDGDIAFANLYSDSYIEISGVPLDDFDWRNNRVPRVTSSGFVILRTEVLFWGSDTGGNQVYTPGSSACYQDIIWQSTIPANAATTFYIPLFCIDGDDQVTCLFASGADFSATVSVSITNQYDTDANPGVAFPGGYVPDIAYTQAPFPAYDDMWDYGKL